MNKLFQQIELKLFEWSKRILLYGYNLIDYKPNNYDLFTDISNIKKIDFPENLYFDSVNKKRNKLQSTNEEDLILRAFDFYQGYVGSRMNNFLRGHETYSDESILIQQINYISSVINNFPLQTNLVVSRIMDSTSFEILFKNFKMVENGFLSTSLNIKNNKNLKSESVGVRNKVVLFLKIPKNTKAIYLENSLPENRRRSEFELLIQRGSHIKIDKKFKIFSYQIVFGSVKQSSNHSSICAK